VFFKHFEFINRKVVYDMDLGTQYYKDRLQLELLAVIPRATLFENENKYNAVHQIHKHT
jgi:hypothetical protein